MLSLEGGVWRLRPQLPRLRREVRQDGRGQVQEPEGDSTQKIRQVTKTLINNLPSRHIIMIIAQNTNNKPAGELSDLGPGRRRR